MDLLIFLSGALACYVLCWLRSGLDETSTRTSHSGWNMGCSKLVRHACRCILPHGHPVRIHKCEHGEIWAENPEAQADMVSEN